MPIARIIYTNKIEDSSEVLQILHDRLQEVVASELSTSDVKVDNDSIQLVFEKGHQLNRGNDIKILIDGNDFPERTENIQERADRIASRVEEILSIYLCCNREGFVYVTLQAGGLGKFKF